GSLRKLPKRLQQLSNLPGISRVTENRQAESGFADKNIASYRFKSPAGGIAAALVIARNDNSNPFPPDSALRRTQNVASRMQRYGNLPTRNGLTISGFLPPTRKILAVAT